MSNDIDSIEREIASLIARKHALIEKNREEKLKEVKNLIKQFGFTASQLGLSKDSSKHPKARGEARYANPANPNQTWAGGKGARPLWVKEHLAKGRALEELETRPSSV